MPSVSLYNTRTMLYDFIVEDLSTLKLTFDRQSD